MVELSGLRGEGFAFHCPNASPFIAFPTLDGKAHDSSTTGFLSNFMWD